MENEIIRQMSNLVHGDAFEIVRDEIQTKSWEELKLPLPPKPDVVNAVDVSKYVLKRKWEIAGPVDKATPIAAFTFPAPVDHYYGEVKMMTGSMTLDASNSFKNAEGNFTADMKTFTMGDKQLDLSLFESFKTAVYPEAVFTFKETGEEDGPVAFGKTNKVSITGMLDFMGIKNDVNTTAQIEPVIDAEGQLFLSVFASFRLRLDDPYKLDRPVGPYPQNDTVIFYLNFLMKPID